MSHADVVQPFLLPCRIFAPCQLVPDVGVDDQHHDGLVRERHRLDFHGPAVNLDSKAFFAHDRDELIHDAARHAGKLVLCLLTRQRLLLPREALGVRQGLQERVERYLQRGRAGQASTYVHGRLVNYVRQFLHVVVVVPLYFKSSSSNARILIASEWKVA